jgi:hypothetical protein|tara:strand:- start:51 stop:794 length:744 start_codon:yes stop_codon:yes gene_type:complete
MKSLTKVKNHWAKGIYSIDTRNKAMNDKMFFDAITNTLATSIELRYKADHGFYKVGMLLNKAKLELGIGNFGKLKKQLAKNKFHEKMQERYMAIARDKRIAKLYGKMPPQWTFWEKCVRLSDDDFHKVKHLITNETQWKDISVALGKNERRLDGKRSQANERDNRSEIFGLEITKNFYKKDKNEFLAFTKEIKKLATKYKFLKLNQKNYFDHAYDFATNKLVQDDTSNKDDLPRRTLKYNSKSKKEL